MTILSADEDEGTRNTAFYTLQTWNAEELQQVLSNPNTSILVLDFAANNLVSERKELSEALLGNPSLPEDLRGWVKRLSGRAGESEATLTTAPVPDIVPVEEAGPGGEKVPPERETLLQRIGRMSAAEKIKCALTGNQEERLVLIRDSNKIVARAVLQSPKLTDQEIENIASMKSVTEEVLRLIAMNRKFMKSYSVIRQLINNPRTPIDVGLPLLHRLNDRDIKGLMLNKNISEVIRGMALRMMKQKEEASKPKLPAGKH